MQSASYHLLALLAANPAPGQPDASPWVVFLWHLFALWAFGLSGIAILYIGYWFFDKLTPGVHFTRELVEKGNVAVAIMIASVLIGVALIVAATMLG